MKRFITSLGLLSLGALFSTMTARAQYRSFSTGDSGFYWSFDAGAAIPMDGHITEFGPFATGQKVSYDVGFGGDIGGGYAFNKYVSAELQLGGTWDHINSVEGASLHDTTFSTLPILANLVLQYPIPQTRLVPYIGGGVGGAATFFDTDEFYQTVPGGFVSIHGSDSDFVFAWQGLAGLRLQLNSRMSVGVGYHFLYLDPSHFTYPSYHQHEPDLHVGFSSFESHLATLTFQFKF
jgi:opacity protein-like surface antigen